MKTINYLPGSDSDRVLWLNQFAVKLATYQTTLSISTAELQSVQKDASMFGYIMGLQDLAKQTMQNITAYKNLIKKNVANQTNNALPQMPATPTAPAAVNPGILDRISNLVQRIKHHTNYTDAIGQDLNIIAPVSIVNINTLEPDIKIQLEGGRPVLKWKKGETDALDLYVDRGDGVGFIKIERIMQPVFVDTSPLTGTTVLAEWKYKGIYIIADTQVGLMSPVVSVVVKKM